MVDDTRHIACRALLISAKVALIVLAFFVMLSVAAWFNRDSLLRDVAELWIVSDSVAPADAVAVLGGNLTTRPFAAAEYYRAGLTKKIIVSNVGLDKAETAGGLPSHTELNRKVLLTLGVPDNAIEVFGDKPSDTHDEAIALRKWAVRTHAHNIIVPTEIFASRRVRWVMDHEFAESGIQVRVLALDDPQYSRTQWWKNHIGLITFQNEILKYIYYRLNY